jgi:hypothetical protein
MTKHKIKTATAVYTGGGIYIYYGQLESGLYFRAFDECPEDDGYNPIYICNSDTEAEEADYWEFYEAHMVEELTHDDAIEFWNTMLRHIIDGKPAHGEWSNYDEYDLERRILKPATPPTAEELQERISLALETELEKIYSELRIDSGDISPSDANEWDRITGAAAALFQKLIAWNANDE